MTDPGTPLLEVNDLVVNYGTARGSAPAGNAVDHVSLTLHPGETLGLVGESGSGKSSIARSIAGLTPWSGRIVFDGEDLGSLDRPAMRQVRRSLQMIFQDPHGALDPRMTAGAQIAEPLRAHRLVSRDALPGRVADLLERVGLDPGMARRFPHEFSGGQRQRIAIARAIGLSPKLLVCDEPTSALDVSVQAQILDLLDELQREHGIACLFIAHNLGVVRRISHRVAVMYLGEIIETGTVEDVFDNPRHRYTQALLDAVLEPDPASRHAATSIASDLTSPADLAGGAA